MLLSLFCGAGGLDLGFEQAGYTIGLAYDKRVDAVKSYNANRTGSETARVADLTQLQIGDLDSAYGQLFKPKGVIGGPPCQSFSKANAGRCLSDPRAMMVSRFIDIALMVHHRSPLDFIVMENVSELISAAGGNLLNEQIGRLEEAGFAVNVEVLNAAQFCVPQNRVRMFLVALHGERISNGWAAPLPTCKKPRPISQFIRDLPNPDYFDRNLPPSEDRIHPNHWCMRPKSARFFNGTLKPGYSAGRSFKTLTWEKPSFAVSYGNREVHVHPDGQRRLSVFEAMLLQGFPPDYVLYGTLSSQITQVSEAVPPPLSRAVAESIFDLEDTIKDPQTHRTAEVPRVRNQPQPIGL